MPTPQKAETVELVKERYERSAGVLFTEYRGLPVRDLQALRAELKSKGGEIQVVKNTLFKRATGEDAAKLPEEITSGPTAVAFVYENEADCAKVLVDFTKKNKNFVVKGGLVGGKFFDAEGIKALSELPPYDVLIAQVIGTIAAPLSQLVGTIEGIYAGPVRAIGAVADKVAEGGGPVEAAPAAEAPAEEAPVAEEAPAETPAAADEAAAPTEESDQE